MTERPNKRRSAPLTRSKPEPRRPDPGISVAIGLQLRATYDKVLTEPVPTELSDLVMRLTKSIDGTGKA